MPILNEILFFLDFLAWSFIHKWQDQSFLFGNGLLEPSFSIGKVFKNLRNTDNLGAVMSPPETE